MPTIRQGFYQPKFRRGTMFNSVKTRHAKIELSVINSDLASFNCNGSITGFVHLPNVGPITVVLDGGYTLGEYKNSDHAVEGISFLCLEVEDADKRAGMNYQAYMQTFKAGFASRMH
jgi:hypothetical protein